MRSENRSPQKSVVMLTTDRCIDRRISLEAASLEDAGWDVTIIAMPTDMLDLDHPRVVRLGQGTARAMSVKEGGVLATYKWMRRWLPMNSRLMMWLKAAAWRHFLDQERFFVKAFEPVVSQYRPTVFLAHDLPVLAVARRAAARCGAKLVYDSHELYCEQEFPEDVKRRWAAVEHKHIGVCDAVMTVNPSIARELENRYGLDEVEVVYNAEYARDIEHEERYFHKYFSLADKDKVLLFQGGVTVGRNIELLVSAMRLLLNKHVHLVLLGNGTLVQTLRRRSQELGVAGVVHFHPAVPQTDLLRLTASADAGLIPYQAICLNNYYCTPNKLFEFIAAGIPVLGSDLPEINHIVTTQGIGRVADLGSEPRMAAAIDTFFSDDAQLCKWRDNAKTARSVFSWDHEGRKVVELFEKLLHSGVTP
ncbi:glycosyltransferase family 4 protein [Allopusillimonas ginsengisoli]|nr:glycosyltransferase family 4 protein [Allopusillimonas ginsengisoli]